MSRGVCVTAGSPAGKPEMGSPPTIIVEVPGRPATKKTGQRIVKDRRTGRTRIIPNRLTTGWTEWARIQMRAQYTGKPLAGPVAVVYNIRRQWDRGDLGGFEAAIDDAMQGILIENDSQIMERRSIKSVDREKPGVVIGIMELP